MQANRIVALASQKGGTGKTTTSINLGASLAGMGQKVLLIDTDPQANLSIGLGITLNDLENASADIMVDKSIYDVMLNPGRGLDMAICPTRIHNLDLVPSTMDLAGAEVELAHKTDKNWVLGQAMDRSKQRYDFVLIDTPPSLGLFTQNALLAATEVIVTLQMHFFGLKAVEQLLRAMNLLQEFNKALHMSGIVCTMYDRRNNLSKVIEETIREEFRDLVFDTVIPVNISLAEAPASGQPISIYASSSTGAKAYYDLAKEVMCRGQ